MANSLLISVRFHDGRYHGADDWPPSPARLFQALVASAAKPSLDVSRDTLEWLEKLDAPIIAAPAAIQGQPNFKLFMPNNDLDAKGGDIRRMAEIRSATKHIRPRLFDASVPLLYVWHFENGDAQAKKICEIAEGLYQLGRGVDMAWAVGEVQNETAADERLARYPGVVYRPSSGGEGTKLDCPQDGSLEGLIERHQAGAVRFRHVRDEKGKLVRTEFTNAPRARFRSVAYNSPSTKLLFDLQRTTEPKSPFAPWPLKRVAELVKTVRDCAAERLCTGLPDRKNEIERVFIGRDSKEADKALRLRIVALPSIGHVHVKRSVRRMLVDVPPDCPIAVKDIAWAFSGLDVAAPGVDEETGEIVSSPVQLVTADDCSMLKHYGLVADDGEGSVSSRLWRSVTPLALPDATRRRIDPVKQREQAKKGSERQSENLEAMHEVAQALRHAGLRHRIANLRVQREPFEAKGECAEAFAGGSRFSKHQLWHVEIEFAEPVNGPIVLGSGRYCGLGLMAPVQKVEDVLSFAIADGLADKAEPLDIARALRRAVMARVQDKLGKRTKLPVFFTGHEPNGKPARRGYRSHLAYVFDNANHRLLVFAPHLLEHRKPDAKERKHIETLASALLDMQELRTGVAGKLSLTRETIDSNFDPLFALSKTWHTQTIYRPTYHQKRVPPEQAITADVIREIERRHLPKPSSVQITSLSKGARGGLYANIHLTFRVGVSGPILIGQTSNFGGGLFTTEGREFSAI